MLVKKFDYKNGIISFSTGDGNPVNAELSFGWSDKEHTKQYVKGKIWYASQPEPADDNVYADSRQLEHPLSIWQGMYKTFQKRDDGKWTAGKELVIQAGRDSESSKVFYGGTEIHNFTYAVPVLSWNENGGNDTSAAISLYGSDLPAFNGKICQKGEKLPSENNFFGSYDDKYLSEWSGYYSSMIEIMIPMEWLLFTIHRQISAKNLQDSIGKREKRNQRKSSGVEKLITVTC